MLPPEIFESLEVRWFFEGEPPFEPSSLYSKKPSVGQRRDLYLLTEDDSIGIKARGDSEKPSMEIKTRQSRNCEKFGDASGCLESWVKWSWKGAAAPERASERWQSVEKLRLLWPFHWDGESLDIASGQETVSNGGAVELTRLCFDNRLFWTVAVEAFDATEDSPVMVLTAAKSLLSRLEGIVPDAANSYGYPKWLMLHGAEDRVTR